MEYIAPILQAIASLAWAGFAFTALFVLKRQIARAFGRLTRAEFFGQKIELRAEIDELSVSAAATEKEVQELPRRLLFQAEAGQYSLGGETATVHADQQEALDATVKFILQQAASDPKVALMAVAAELEKQARQALATRGVLGGRRAVSLNQALGELINYGFPPNLARTLRLFLDVRNKVVHGMAATNDDALSALDSGLILLRALSALPNETIIVYHPGVEVFFDAECKQPITDAKGLIVETTSAGGAIKTKGIFPTTRAHYQKGKRVAVEWNMQKKWPQAWYRDPDTGEIKSAWVESAEFIGRHLEDI
jgi:hypothetical protein